MKWLPLPKIAHGIAIYPFSPSIVRPQQIQDDQSTDTHISSTSAEDYNHLISLEVGDELFIVEQQGQWYRGYVLRPLEQGIKPNKAPIGCFPRTHVQIKEYIDIEPDSTFVQKREITATRPLSELNALPRSFSESHIPKATNQPKAVRPGSFGDLNFDHYETPESKKSYTAHIPPPPLPLERFDQSTLIGSSEPLVDEIAACVSDWNSLLYTYINQRQYSTFNIVRDHINYLFQARRQLLDQALSREELIKLRKEIVNRMVLSNMEQHQDMIIRHPEKGYLLDATNSSISTIYRMHFKYATHTDSVSDNSNSSSINHNSNDNNNDNSGNNNNSNNSSISNTVLDHSASTSTINTQASSSTTLSSVQLQLKGAKFHHLFFELKACVAHICQPGEYTELYFSLYNALERKFLTEQFVVVLTFNGMPKDETQIGKLQSLFVDLSLHDITDDLYMVCHVVRLGAMKMSDSRDHFGSLGAHTSQLFHSSKHLHQSFQPKSPQANNTMCRRPFGCAVLKLSILSSMYNNHGNDEKVSSEQDMPIFTALSESNFSTLHQDIIFGNTKEFTKNPRAETLRVFIRPFYGFLNEVLKTNAGLLGDVPHTLRLGFADVVFPNDSRNDLYIKLEMGDLSQFGRSRNIQVTMCVRDNKSGEVVDNAISVGAGARPISYWESMVIYHEQRPKWGELIKIHIQDVQQWERSHVFVTVKHRSSNFTGSNSNTPMLKFSHHNSYQTNITAATAASSAFTNNNNGGDLPNQHPTAVTSSTSGGGEKILAMGFLPLFLPPLHRDFVADGTHALHLYKYDRQYSLPRYYLNTAPWCTRSTAPSNTVQYSDATSRLPRPLYKSKGDYDLSPSTQSFMSLNGSLNSSVTAFNATSTSSSTTDLGSSTHYPQGSSKLSLLRDTITLTTSLCSNIFTQNRVLVKLLNWRALIEVGTEDGTSELLSVLDQFTFVGEVEVVKFLSDIFDALLEILTYQNQDISELVIGEIHDQVLSAIVWLLGIVQDRRFSNFRPVLDVYIDNRFSIQQDNNHLTPKNTCEYLMRSLSRLCQNPGEPSKAKLLRSSMKVWDYLFRFIARSRLHQQQIEQDDKRISNDMTFKKELGQLLHEITSIMKPEHPSSMIGTQTLLLQHFADILVELKKIFEPKEVVDIAVSFVDACSYVTGRLVGFKLAMILSIVKGPTFDDPSCRLGMAKNVFRWIRLWINSYMATAKDVIFARQTEQQQTDNSHLQQTRLPRSQWIENLRLSLTIMSELLDKVRKSFGMLPSGLTSSCISSPSIINQSRPTSFVDDALNQENSTTELNQITQHALQLVLPLLNAYKDIQRLTIQAMHVSSAPSGTAIIETHSSSTVPTHGARPHSRQSFSVLRERASSIGASSKNPMLSPELLQESQHGHHQRSSSIGNTNSAPNTTGLANGFVNPNANIKAKSKFTVVLQALSTSPTSPFPSTYPFQPANKSAHATGLGSDQAAMISTGLLDLTVVFLELFYMTPRQQWIDFIKRMAEIDGVQDAAEFLIKIVYTCMSILFGDNIMTLEESSLTVDGMSRSEEDDSRSKRRLPEKWLNLDTIAHQIVMCDILEPIKAVFELPQFMPTEKAYFASEQQQQQHEGFEAPLATMDEEVNSCNSPQESSKVMSRPNSITEQQSTLLLWRVYLVGFLRVIASPRLDISKSMPQTQRALWKIIGNIRGEVGAKVFLFLWQLAGKSELNIAGASKAISADHDVSSSSTRQYQQQQQQHYSQHPMNDYFGSEASHTMPALSSEYGYFPDESLRKSMASIEEVDDDDYNMSSTQTSSTISNSNSNYSIRNSIRIGPTDELPLSSIHEEKYGDSITEEPNVSFLQADLVYFILSPMCAVSLTLHDRVRINALTVIADIIVIELYSFGELCHAQHTMISTLDRLVMSENKCDETICGYITTELSAAVEQRLQTHQRRDLLLAGKRAVESLCKFLGLLLQIRSLPMDDDEFMDERITATLKLMKFIQVIEREEIYIKYVHELVQLHLDSRNFIEAALTLRFHADLLHWDPSDKLIGIPELSFPAQSSFSRKESLLMKMITYLDQGNAWELCIQLCKELAYEYENTIYDYIKLGEILQRQASFSENIAKKERCFTEYFRVGFYGRGFPASSRNRQYIYRGLEWEKMSSFVERMQNRHPNARLLPNQISNSMSLSDDQLRELESTLDGQFLQITPVTPIPDVDTIPCLTNPNAPDSIKKYYASNSVYRFYFSRPVTREIADDENKQPESDFLNLWTERLEFECEDRFPTIVRRSKIISSHTKVISPIENAVTAMENKNKELESLEKKYASYVPRNSRRMSSISQPININPFSMSLNGAVDAPVNGGVPLYKKAFLSKDYWEKNPDMREWIHRLEDAIHDQVVIIKKCLETHNKLVSNEMRPFHTTLTEFFHKNFADEIKSLKARSIKDETRDKHSLSISTATNSIGRRRSTLSSATTENASLYGNQLSDDIKVTSPMLTRQNSTVQTPGIGGIPVLPTLPVMSPISRAFSIRTPVAESSPGLPSSSNLFENATMSRAESLSRTLKISLRKKTRKKSQSSGSTHLMGNNPS